MEYGALLTERLWLNGYGYIALSANGSMLERTPIDSAVFSPERLDFVGKPVIANSGLKYLAPETVYVEGKMLDLSTLPALTVKEAQQVSQLKAEAKVLMQQDSATKKGEWVAQKVSELVDKGTDLDTARSTVAAMVGGGGKDLFGSFTLVFSDPMLGTVTVCNVLSKPERYDGKSLADPLEGVGYGKSLAKFYYNNGDTPLINSFAHGGCIYFLHSGQDLLNSLGHGSSNAFVGDADAFNDIFCRTTDTEIPNNDKVHVGEIVDDEVVLDWKEIYRLHVEKWNQRYASVIVGGKHRVMRLEDGSSAYDGREYYAFYKREELSKTFDNTLIQTGVSGSGASIKPVYKNHLMAWAFSPKSRSYTGGVVFLPDKSTAKDYFNTWEGFSVKQKQNDLLCALILMHIRTVLCDDNIELYDYFIAWIALSMQKPWDVIGTAIVARGGKGSGKGSVGNFLHNIWGKHGIHITNAKHLIGSFNGHLNDICFIFCDEAFFSGDKQHEGVLKGLITEPKYMSERKGLDAVPQNNLFKLFMATNSDWAVPASRDERRYCVLDVSDKRVNDTAYFEELASATASKEVQAAFLYMMLNYDLSNYNVREIPDTVGLKAQRLQSFEPHQKWLADVLHSGSFGGDFLINGRSNSWPPTVASKALYTNYLTWCDQAKIGEYGRVTKIALTKYLSHIFMNIRRVDGRDSGRGFKLGTLEEAVAAFEKYEKVDVDA
jgi:hypothetical protein